MPELTGIVTEPGLYPDVPEHLYHADPVMGQSLSVSGAKLLVPPRPPAKFDYARRHPKAPTRSMGLGTVVHAEVLGKGQDVAVLDYPDYKKKAAQEARDAAIAEGRVPMLAHEYEQAKVIAQSVRGHGTAGALFAEGDPEVSMFWQDEEFGIWCRGRLDWLTYVDGQPVIGDLKTGRDAGEEGFAKAAAEFNYHMQDPWYRWGLSVLLKCDPDDVEFWFAVVETEPPYLTAVHRIIPEHAALGAEQGRQAREVYRDCTKAGVWPGYGDHIHDLALPRYSVQQIERDINDWYN